MRRSPTRRLLLPLLTAGLLVPAASAQAKVSVKVVGWTTSGTSPSPEAPNGGTLSSCSDLPNGQRSLFAIYKGKGIAKKAKVTAVIWGGPAALGMTMEPAPKPADAFGWPVGPKKAYTAKKGFSVAPSSFGPVDTNGTWNAKVLLKGKVVATGSVTVAC